MLEWAAQPGPRSVERIFGVPIANTGLRRLMISYLRQHAMDIEEITKYQAYVFEYTANADLLNMALFDREVAFIAVSGPHPENLSGARILDSEYAALLVSFFEQLLPGCQRLEQYLEDQDKIAD
jgi:hypothetical protein